MLLPPKSRVVIAGHLRRITSSWRRASLSSWQSCRESEESVREFPRDTREGMRDVSMLGREGREKKDTWFRRG